jgi:hypothetical protein
MVASGSRTMIAYDRWIFIPLFPAILEVLTIVQPETIVRWHRAGFHCCGRRVTRISPSPGAYRRRLSRLAGEPLALCGEKRARPAGVILLIDRKLTVTPVIGGYLIIEPERNLISCDDRVAEMIVDAGADDVTIVLAIERSAFDRCTRDRRNWQR